MLILVPLLLLFSTSPLRAEPKTYMVVPEKSQVMFEASFPLGDFTGITQELRGEFQADPQNLGEGIRGTVTVNPASLKTGNEGRDRDLQKTLGVERYPEIRFSVQEIRTSFPSLAERTDTHLTITGGLLIHGLERPIRLRGRAQLRDGQVWVRGEGVLRMTDYGIKPPTKFFLSVRDQTRVSFDVLLTPGE